jgi:hypothetical protein
VARHDKRVLDSVGEHGLDYLSEDERVCFLVSIADGEVNNRGIACGVFQLDRRFFAVSP